MANRKDLFSAHGRLVGWLEEDAVGRVNIFGWNGKLYGFSYNSHSLRKGFPQDKRKS